jgi:hypothetical protein
LAFAPSSLILANKFLPVNWALAVIESLGILKKSLLIFYIVWLSLVVGIPLTLLIAMGAIVDDFIPSNKLFPYANYLNIFNFIVLFFTYIVVSNKINSPELKFLNITKKKLAACYLVAWILLSALSYSSFSGPLSYILHKTSEAKYGYLIENVIETTALYKRCDRHLRLSGDFLIYNRKVCYASSKDVRELSNGGKIKMFGNINEYGISSFSYGRIDG